MSECVRMLPSFTKLSTQSSNGNASGGPHRKRQRDEWMSHIRANEVVYSVDGVGFGVAKTTKSIFEIMCNAAKATNSGGSRGSWNVVYFCPNFMDDFHFGRSVVVSETVAIRESTNDGTLTRKILEQEIELTIFAHRMGIGPAIYGAVIFKSVPYFDITNENFGHVTYALKNRLIGTNDAMTEWLRRIKNEKDENKIRLLKSELITLKLYYDNVNASLVPQLRLVMEKGISVVYVIKNSPLLLRRVAEEIVRVCHLCGESKLMLFDIRPENMIYLEGKNEVRFIDFDVKFSAILNDGDWLPIFVEELDRLYAVLDCEQFSVMLKSMYIEWEDTLKKTGWSVIYDGQAKHLHIEDLTDVMNPASPQPLELAVLAIYMLQHYLYRLDEKTNRLVTRCTSDPLMLDPGGGPFVEQLLKWLRMLDPGGGPFVEQLLKWLRNGIPPSDSHTHSNRG